MKKDTLVTVSVILVVGVVLAYMIKKNMEPQSDERKAMDAF
jgi:hypothetical protein